MFFVTTGLEINHRYISFFFVSCRFTIPQLWSLALEIRIIPCNQILSRYTLPKYFPQPSDIDSSKTYPMTYQCIWHTEERAESSSKKLTRLQAWGEELR